MHTNVNGGIVTIMLKKNKLKITLASFVFILSFSTFAVFSQPVNAQSPNMLFAAPVSCGTSADCKTLYEKYINPFVRLLTAAVGVLAVLMIVIGGVQYSSAGSDPQKVAAAKQRIINAIIGLVAYIFLFGFLNWVVPGGIA